METSVDNIDTERLITSIENQPALWDSSHDSYSDRVAKKNVWETVIKEFIVDFNCKTPTEKKEIAAAVQRKWKHLRDSFTREVAKKKQEARSGSGSSARKAYIYFEQLKFLQTAIKTTNSSLDDEQSQNRTLAADQDSSRDTQSCSSPELFEVEPPSQKRKKKTTKKTVTESDDLLLHTLKNQFLQKQQDVTDEDRLFMLSLVPELKKLPEHVKLEVKSSTMTTISNARLRELRSQQYSSSLRPTPNYYNSYHEGPPTHATSNQAAWTPTFHSNNSGQQPTFHSHNSGQQQAWSTQPIVNNVEKNVTVTVPVTIGCGAVYQARPHQENMSTSSNCQANSPESELSEYDFS